jgi:uncharacterized FlgJ-related protein
MKYFTIILLSYFTLSSNGLEVRSEKIEINKEILVKTMKEMGIQHVDIVLAQAILESGTFTSKVFKTKNNMFGMKVPGRRETTAINKKGYAAYSSWYDCVKDYKLYQDYITKNKPISRDQYVAIISKRYSETPDYMQRLKKIIEKNKHYV